MKKKEAIQRLGWRFANHSTFNVNAKDIEAWNTIIELVNSHDADGFKNNQLFAKAYIGLLKATLEHYGTDIFDSKPQKAMHKYLEKPLQWHIKEFVEYLNLSAMYERIENGKLESAENAFTVEDVEMNTKQMVNECLRKYGNV
ncbi:hypothetical protein D2V93_08500 [Flagellimonas taeanensis]|uniref:hypothetical protein n=1 Tax=Flagellimonas taeanensis TaxID=1005926 RepID=UPI000E6A7563|nr:hypothetical protein [Allomuricauda taeanensis]RIV50901.1 hypothetical protein D2V93_08500 [Allomuricauda taeanensis]